MQKKKKKRKTGKERKGEIKRGRDDVTYIICKIEWQNEMCATVKVKMLGEMAESMLEDEKKKIGK